MKPKMKKALKRAAIIGTGVLAFAGTFIGGYMVTPNRTKYIDVSVEEAEPTAFGQFVEKITKDIGLTEDNDSADKFLSASFDDLKIKYKKGDNTFENVVALDGGVDFRMSAISFSGIEFNVDATATYNGKQLPLTLGHFHHDIYFGLKDMKLKFTEFNSKKLIDEYWYAFALYANLDFPQMLEGLGELIGEKVVPMIEGLLNGSEEEEPANAKGIEDVDAGGFDFSSLLANGPKEEQNPVTKDWTFTLGQETDDICIKVISDEKFTLKRVELVKLAMSGISVSGAINASLKDYDDFVSPAASNDYIEVFNYSGITHKLLTMLKEDGNHQKAGFEFAFDLDNVENANAPIDIARVEGSMNVDFDQLLDLSQYQVGAAKNNNQQQAEEQSSLADTLKKVGFNFQVDLIGQNNIEYANLDLSFANGAGYLRFNEQEDDKAVMKLKMDTETFNRIMDKVPDVVESAGGDTSTQSVSKLTDFLTDDLASAVEKGDYSFILDILETFENDENGIRLGLDLSQLGIGENARVDVELLNDARYPNFNDLLTDPNKTDEEKEAAFNLIDTYTNASGFSINASNISFGNYLANITAGTSEFKNVELGNVNSYQSVKFIPDIIDQMSDFTREKQTGFHLNGSMKDSNGLGVSFSGRGQLDNNDEVKEGYGTLHFDEYKYKSNKVWATHDVAVNVTNLASNIDKAYDNDGNLISQTNNNKALFVYGDPSGSKNVKGQLKLQTFSDIVDIFSTFLDEYGSDPKFTKFLAPITEMLGFGALGDIINSKDYVKLASNELLKEVSVINNGQTIRIVISKVMLNLPSDITLDIGLKGDYDSENQGLHSLDIVNFALGSGDGAKLLNMHFELDDYDENYHNMINKNDTFMDLNGIKVLLDLGINTTKVNLYHLSASAHVATVLGIDIEISGINFYVYTDGKTAKVYGKINSIPTILFVTQDVNDELFTGEKFMSCEFSFETFNDDVHNDVAGMFNIRRSLDDDGTEVEPTWKWPFYINHEYTDHKFYHYRSDSANFMDDIVNYLMGGVIGLNSTAMNTIVGSSSSSSSSEKDPGNFTNTFTDTGFALTEKGSGMSKVYTIKLGLNLNELTGISALKELEATIDSKRIAYTHNGKNSTLDILGSLSATLRINFLVDVNLRFNASVEEAQFDPAAALSRWNTLGQPGLTDLSGNVNGIAISATENSQYYNNSTNPYIYTIREYKS